jgi:hypothetical protein
MATMQTPLDPTREVETAARRAVAVVSTLATGAPIDPSLRVNVHFHPDRTYRGEPILTSMIRDGLYRSQFETGTSNGGLTAYPGGDRWRWESRIFAGAYDGASPAERPKYGALNFRRSRVGASPRFGSAFLRLAVHTLARTTFCYPDSVFEPKHFGVAERMALIPLAESIPSDPLDGYIEAQTHGPLRFADDVEAIVLDPCYRGTEVEHHARTLPCSVEWHEGFRLSSAELAQNPEYRGREYVELGLSLSRDGWLTPKDIGDASRTGKYDAQSLKRVWHYVARFGAPAVSDETP